ncbi:MAG TPA: hypothetical protein DEF42_15840 [Desulfosporosinus sp.]|nr:hypothetical protein [Desulfosporosinus sp.]
MEDTKLWRYFDLIKFLTFVNGELYFTRADKFKDKYEGAIPKQNYNAHVEWMISSERNRSRIDEIRKEFYVKFKEKKNKAAISCWHINESESAAMWETYARAGQGIAISTTINKLKKIQKPDGFELEMFNVEYIDFDREYDEDYNRFELLPFKNKRKEFQYEQEFRMILYQNNPLSEPFKGVEINFSNPMKVGDIIKYGFVSKLNDIPSEGIKVKVNPYELIDEIIASPYMKDYEIIEIQRILDLINKDKQTNFTIKRSHLYEDVNY